ncbi:hypothetical protein E2320_021495 [Naja naja]|nr:hypothetical protein E2320_021495 [Naja naja]
MGRDFQQRKAKGGRGVRGGGGCKPMHRTVIGEDQGTREGREAFLLCKEGEAAGDGSDGRAGRTSPFLLGCGPFPSRFPRVWKKSVPIENYNFLKPVKKQEPNLSGHRSPKTDQSNLQDSSLKVYSDSEDDFMQLQKGMVKITIPLNQQLQAERVSPAPFPIPLLQASRLKKIASHPTTLFQVVQCQDAFGLLQHQMNQPCRFNAAAVTSKAEVREEWKTALLTSVDSRQLGVPRINVASHDWLLCPSRGIQLRGGVLPTRSWSAWSANHQTTDKTCREACRALEMINHMLQVCERLDLFLHWQGLRLSDKPIITSGTSFIKPDLLVEAMNWPWVMDVRSVQLLNAGDLGHQGLQVQTA